MIPKWVLRFDIYEKSSHFGSKSEAAFQKEAERAKGR